MPTPTPAAKTEIIPAEPTPGSGATLTKLTSLWKGRSPAAAADSVWVPAASGALIVAAGAMSLATGRPWLFAGIGPTAVLIAASPGHATTRFHAVVGGHVVALVCAWLAVLLLGATGAPSLAAGPAVPVVRVWASAIAVALTTLVQPSLRAYHPPAAATALLVTLGAYRLNWKNAGALLGGVLVVALLGEWFQRIRLAERQRAHGTRR